MTSSQPTATQQAAVRATPTLGWAIRRAILGIAIMTVTITGAACLLYFTIDGDAEARTELDASARKTVTGPATLPLQR